MTLKELAIGKSAVIRTVGASGALRQHFLDMGMIPGAEVTVVKFAPMGDPMELQVHGYELTLRLAEAEQIEVEEISERTNSHSRGERLKPVDHPGLGEEGKYHSEEDANPLPDGTVLTYALVGNQNCGKTTLFNQLTGANQHVGNFPGVTVDRKDGTIKGYPNTNVTDLPGIYSMSPYSSEEIVTRNFVLDEQGKLCADEEKVFAFVDWLADTYDTVGAERTFHATRGDIVKVEGGIYGNLIDREAEKEYLLDAFLQKKAEIHTPVYSQMARKQGLDDIGDTYIEVDMTEQKMYYYEKGVLKLETEIVTGNMRRRMGTPEGVNFVYNKQKNRVLRGPGYASPVKFWMPVKGGIGIHDAGWRKEFGGDIYQTAGSHGCINTPKDKMEELFDCVQIGTPVVMFY